MANHCVYETCFNCKTQYCTIGCGFTCKCEKETTDPQKQKDAANALKWVYDDMPEGWF